MGGILQDSFHVGYYTIPQDPVDPVYSFYQGLNNLHRNKLESGEKRGFSGVMLVKHVYLEQHIGIESCHLQESQQNGFYPS